MLFCAVFGDISLDEWYWYVFCMISEIPDSNNIFVLILDITNLDVAFKVTVDNYTRPNSAPFCMPITSLCVQQVPTAWYFWQARRSSDDIDSLSDMLILKKKNIVNSN